MNAENQKKIDAWAEYINRFYEAYDFLESFAMELRPLMAALATYVKYRSDVSSEFFFLCDESDVCCGECLLDKYLENVCEMTDCMVEKSADLYRLVLEEYGLLPKDGK